LRGTSILITELDELLADDCSESSLFWCCETCWGSGTEREVEIMIQRYVVEKAYLLERLVCETSELKNEEQWMRRIEQVEKTRDTEGYLNSLSNGNGVMLLKGRMMMFLLCGF